MVQPENYNDINWSALRARAMIKKGWKKKGPKEWDQKAASFSTRTRYHGYVDLFISHLPLDESMTVLDIGSGPGTLSIPIAAKAAKVTAIDFSKGMLDTLSSYATKSGQSNISTIQGAWEDDWDKLGLVPHDIAIASRSMGVEDLEAALVKINNFATQYVFISDRIGATPFEAAAFTAIGRPFHPGPDYIFTLNMLYTLGIHAHVTILEIDRQIHYSSMDKALKSFTWMFQDLTVEEESTLKDYITTRIIHQDDTGITIERETAVRWALIWWKKD